jgi:putative membrane protein
MKRRFLEMVLGITLLAQPTRLLAQGRFYEWHWEMHPMWTGAWAIGVMLLMLLFWVVVIVGFVVGVRWLLGRRRSSPADSALTILRERYARGEIEKDEFEQKIKDLS